MAWVVSMGVLHAQLPAITLKTIDGQSVRTDTLSNNGKPFIIDFFATWCKPCNRELDAIAEVYSTKLNRSSAITIGLTRYCLTPTAT